MPERVREAVFSMIGSLWGSGGSLPALGVADVFAGSGASGLEALSRGAEHCVFYESDPRAVRVLNDNIQSLNATSRATVRRRDAWQALAEAPDGRSVELVFLDPPYADSDDASPGGRVRQFLGRLREAGGPRPVVVLHHRARVAFDRVTDDGWELHRCRQFGTHGITVLL